jgi:uncharacterized protein (DUF488 family)
VADVRRYPHSRRHPQFNAETFAAALRSEEIAVEQFGETLGGRRQPHRDSPNTGWRVKGFRGYADHMASEEFGRGLAKLQELARRVPTGVMCAEADWRRCHRRLIADALQREGWRVRHIQPSGRVEPHEITPFAVVDGERVTYPPVEASLG